MDNEETQTIGKYIPDDKGGFVWTEFDIEPCEVCHRNAFSCECPCTCADKECDEYHKHEYEIQGSYGYGWERLTTEETLADANAQLATYRANESIPLRIKRVRVTI